MKPRLASFIILTTASFVYLFSSYGANLWLARKLGPHEYGLYGLIISIITIINLIQTSAIPQSAAKLIAKDESHAKKILGNALLLQLILTFILSVGLFLSAGLIATLLHDTSLTSLIQLSALILPAYGVYSLYYGYFNGLHDFKRQAQINVLYSLGKVTGIIGLSYYYGLNGAIVGFAFAGVFSLLFVLKNIVPLKVTHHNKALIYYSLPLIGSAAGLTLFLNLDLLLVKSLIKDNVQVGIYAAAQNIAIIPFLGLSAFALIIFPTVAKSLKANDMLKTTNVIQSTLRLVYALIIPVSAIMMATSYAILKLFYGNDYVAAKDALFILLIAYAILTVFSFLSSVINASGEAKRSWAYAFIGLFAALLGCLILIPAYGLSGAAEGIVTGALTSTVLALMYVARTFKLNLPFKTICNVLLAASIIYFPAHIILVTGLLLLPWYTILMAAYFGILFILREYNDDDKGHWISIIGYIKTIGSK